MLLVIGNEMLPAANCDSLLPCVAFDELVELDAVDELDELDDDDDELQRFFALDAVADLGAFDDLSGTIDAKYIYYNTSGQT